MGRGARLVADDRLLAVDPDEVRREGLAGPRLEDGLERPVLAGRERPDLALPVDDQADRDRLHAPRREAGADFAPQQRTQCVPDEAVDDPARLLRIDQVHVDAARVGERVPDRVGRDLAEGDAARLLGVEVRGLGNVPRDRLALAVEVRREVHEIRAAGGLLDCPDVLAARGNDLVVGAEVMLDVDAELVLAKFLGQVPYVPIRGEDGVAGAEVPLDRLCLGR